ncbi:hypothetical protein LCGC14_2951350, partial [marine sediment metagenome]
MVGTSLYIKIDEGFRFLLSSSSQVQALFYEAVDTGINLIFDSNSIQWNLDNFDISSYIPTIQQGDEFLFWFETQDGIGNIVGSMANQLNSRKYKGIYDSQMSGTAGFQWNLGETNIPNPKGILLFGSDDFKHSSINIDISSIALDYDQNKDVERILIYGSDNGITYGPSPLGRAFYSDSNLWSFNWDNDLSGEIPEDYYIKAYVFDKSGEYLTSLYDVKLYDYDLVELISDLVFGDIIDYDPTLSSNIFDFTGTFYLQNTPINLWDTVAKYYDPLASDWIPLYTQPAVIQTAGSYADYTITWDINQDKDFMDLMYNLTYDFLPLKVVDVSSTNIWGSWGVFDVSGEWRPVLILDSASQIDIVIYEFDSVNGWVID